MADPAKVAGGRQPATLPMHGVQALASRADRPDSHADTPTWSAFSHDIDGQDIKALLRRQGFADHEFRIHMEFQRGWGCL